MRLIKSVEELLYELVTWLLFYPLTLWRAIRHPIRMMRYAETELGDDPEAQYDDTLSPPIFLLITLFVAHLLGQGAGIDSAQLPVLLQEERNLIAFRAIMYSLFPLLMALMVTRVRGVKLTRKSLRPAFYAQCFVAVPFVLAISLAVILASLGDEGPWVGLGLFAAGLVWYGAVETQWLVMLGVKRWRAVLSVCWTLFLSVIAVTVVGGVTLIALS